MRSRLQGLASLAAVYVIWGSSFLAIRLAVQGAHAFPPISLAALRTLLSGALLVALAAASGQSLRVSRRELRGLALSGVLIWVGGNVPLLWGARRLSSGLAALLFASTPLSSAGLSAVLAGGWPRAKEAVSICAGFVGMLFLFPIGKSSLAPGMAAGAVAVLASAFFWALGSLLGREATRSLPLMLASGYQLLIAGVVTATLARLAGESWVWPDRGALAAAAYLVLFPTVVAYLAYAHALKTLPLSWAMSFAYVNPLIAVLLGVAFLSEKLELRSLLGMALILASVVFLFAGSDSKAEQVEKEISDVAH
jgi:drug/metabolite transporter (DMT)-like permease